MLIEKKNTKVFPALYIIGFSSSKFLDELLKHLSFFLKLKFRPAGTFEDNRVAREHFLLTIFLALFNNNGGGGGRGWGLGGDDVFVKKNYLKLK